MPQASGAHAQLDYSWFSASKPRMPHGGKRARGRPLRSRFPGFFPIWTFEFQRKFKWQRCPKSTVKSKHVVGLSPSLSVWWLLFWSFDFFDFGRFHSAWRFEFLREFKLVRCSGLRKRTTLWGHGGFAYGSHGKHRQIRKDLPGLPRSWLRSATSEQGLLSRPSVRLRARPARFERISHP